MTIPETTWLRTRIGDAGRRVKYWSLLLLILVPSATLAQHGSHKEPSPQLIAGLGEMNHPVSTTNAEAQRFFNQGLACLYGFNHEESVRSFKAAAQLDPKLSMAYWGVSLALGSNYNMTAEGPSLLEAYSALQKAKELSVNASEAERAYIAALSKRYSSDVQADPQKLALDYKNAMGELVKNYPDDLDAATLYAESMMNLRPWRLWTEDGQPAEGTKEIVAVLESVLRRDPNHLGANHYYIHAVEASNDALRALGSAERLASLAPGAGHLVHMPAHVYIRTGDYERASQANREAIVADRNYMAKGRTNGLYPMFYYHHNVHFLASTSAMQGRYNDAIKNAREIERLKSKVSEMPMLEMYVPYSLVVMVRFARWNDILRTPKPPARLKITNGFWRFSRGMAFTATKRLARAEAELEALRQLIQQLPAGATFGNNAGKDILNIAESALLGKVLLLKGDKESAYQNLLEAIEAEDRVIYNEPPDWDLPVRELLGAVLLLNGENARAETIFREELVKHPRSGRALFGLGISLQRQGKLEEAKVVQQQFQTEWARSDTSLTISRLAGMN